MRAKFTTEDAEKRGGMSLEFLECSELSELSSASELAARGLIVPRGQFAPELSNSPRLGYLAGITMAVANATQIGATVGDQLIWR